MANNISWVTMTLIGFTSFHLYDYAKDELT